ncbi:MAG: TrmJ/YjtD family RNA methyltransferase [Gemmatimonadetes bacterium]|nr:TrmJ/YjtD family RNA methyltransferase [Gemmatimonadota bacterium]
MSETTEQYSPDSLESAGRRALDRIVVVLYQPQDLVNIALVVRAMKNMDLTRLCLVEPAEFDGWRITGIAHDTSEIVDAVRIVDTFEEAVQDVVRVVATTGRRRAKRQEWSEPRDAAPGILERTEAGDVALVFGREDRGLPNEILDLCDEAVCIPTNPEHKSLNLGHAALLMFYELREAARQLGGLGERDLSGKPRDYAPPATAAQMEDFFRLWERALDQISMFKGADETSKMRSYRRLIRRAEPDGREIRLLEATAWRILHYADRTRARLADELDSDLDWGPDSEPDSDPEPDSDR